MKQLIFLRHAKSDWGTEQLRDIDRHLNSRGYDDAYRTASWFALSQLKPSQLVSSTATRALSTALIFLREMDFGRDKLLLDERLYEAGTKQISEVIGSQDDQLESILLVGHNPGFTDMINLLSEELYFDNLPTCGMVSFNCNCRSWKDVSKKKWPVGFYKFPKDFKN